MAIREACRAHRPVVGLALLAAATTLAAADARAQQAGPSTAGPPPPGLQASIDQAAGQQVPPADDQPKERKFASLLLVPLFSSSPKLGTAGGVLGAWVHTFDPQSRVSMFGVMYEYTSTHSNIGGLFARASFGADHHRVVGIAGFGYIKNDYEDYLGTGQELHTDDDLLAAAGRYLYRVKGNWFIGAQGIATNYQVFGQDPADDMMLDTLGITGYKAVGVGAAVSHDSRDNEDMPVQGWYANLNNTAYRDWLGGADSFDQYRLDIKAFIGHGKGHVFATRQNDVWTANAPESGYATVILRGYKQGQYLAPYMSSIEAEERLRFSTHWGANVFGGVACLYGGVVGSSENSSCYPSYGVGVQFVLKPKDKLLASFEYAHANEDNYGIYLNLGYAW